MRYFATILLSLLLFQSGGPAFLLQLQQAQIRQEMKRAIRAGIPEADLERFVFEDDGRLAGGEHVEWVEPHEFRFRGVMYDVARSQREGARTVLWCVRDDDETAVFAQLDRMAREAGGSGERGAQGERLLRYFHVPIIAPRPERQTLALDASPLPPAAAPSPLRAERCPADPPPEA